MLAVEPGEVLVAELELTPDSSAAAEDASTASLRLADGRQIPARIATIAATRDDASSGWLGPAYRWGGSTPGAGVPMLVAELPGDALGQAVWFEGRRLPIRWLLPSDAARASAVPVRGPGPDAARARLLASRAMPELLDPRLRWRARLAIARLDPWTADEASLPLADPLAAAWAEQWASRWRSAHARLRRADPAVARRLVAALTGVVSTEGGPLPAWPQDVGAIDDLLDDILRRGADDASVVRAARRYLSAAEAWVAWIDDDAGGPVAGTVRVANTGGAPALLSLRAPGGDWVAHGMVRPGEVARVALPPPPVEGAAAGVWRVRFAGEVRRLAAGAGAAPIEPPGFAVGPFWFDWTWPSLRAQRARAPRAGDPGWVGGLVHRDPRPVLPAGASGWVVHVQVDRPGCALSRETRGGFDRVRISFGPAGAPRGVVSVWCTGVTTASLGAVRQQAAVVRGDGQWSLSLPIDPAWLEDDGTMLLGIESLPHDGPRLSWPRPQLPGVDAVGRVRLDPSGWGGGLGVAVGGN